MAWRWAAAAFCSRPALAIRVRAWLSTSFNYAAKSGYCRTWASKSASIWSKASSAFRLVAYRILEYPKIMRKQYSFFHFPSSYTR